MIRAKEARLRYWGLVMPVSFPFSGVLLEAGMSADAINRCRLQYHLREYHAQTESYGHQLRDGTIEPVDSPSSNRVVRLRSRPFLQR
jgi:hypothetical protein